MAYIRKETQNLATVMSKELYDNVQDGIDEAKHDISSANTRIVEVELKADEALVISKGKNRAKTFNTTADMQNWLKVEANKGELLIGDNLYIVDINVPDWWVTEVLTTVDPLTGYYYKIAQLETQKVSLVEVEANITRLQNTMAKHASQHASGGSDPITPALIGAVPALETNGYNFVNKGNNTVNIDEVFNYNYVVAISDSTHGNNPANTGWVNVMNLFSTHFVTQIAISCTTSTVANRGVKMWVRERYPSSGVWSNWKTVSMMSKGTTPLTPGVSPLADDEVYYEYE